MEHQLIINISSPKILPSLRKILNSIDGVKVVRTIKKDTKSATEEIMADEAVMKSIARGEKDLAEGRCQKLTSTEVRSILGL